MLSLHGKNLKRWTFFYFVLVKTAFLNINWLWCTKDKLFISIYNRGGAVTRGVKQCQGGGGGVGHEALSFGCDY